MHARVHELIDGAIVDVGDAEKPMPKTSIVAVRSHQPPAPLSVAPGFLTEIGSTPMVRGAFACEASVVQP